MKRTVRYLHSILPVLVFGAGITAIPLISRAGAQSAASARVPVEQAGPRLPKQAPAPSYTFRGERLAPPAAAHRRRRDTIIQISLLGIVVGVVLLVLLL